MSSLVRSLRKFAKFFC